jgi:hypothetical protein
MHIQVNTNSTTLGTLELEKTVDAIVRDKLARFADRITRAEVHLTDENGPNKTGPDDKRCLIEVRIAGMDPISATDFGSSHDQALRGAANKMKSQLETTLARLRRG